MDPLDRLPDLLAGVGCTACGVSLAADRIELLACRDELAFVEFRCSSCGSSSLGLVVLDDADGSRATTDVARYGEFGPGDEVRLSSGPPIDDADVHRMHRFLAGYEGDLRGLLGPPGPDPGPR